MTGRLQDRRIVVGESRELDLFAGMLEREGAAVIRCPLVTIHDVEDPAPVEAWLRRLAAADFDDLVLFTGEGVRRLVAAAERAGLREAAVAGFGRARRIVRGPKPVKALREIGLAADIAAAAPTSEGILATLEGLDLQGRSVGFQAYPGQSDAVERFLAGRGAACHRVLPYRYACDEEDRRVAEILREMGEGGADLIAFTSRPQIKRLRDVASRFGLEETLERAMERVRIAAIGPVCAQAVEAAGWPVAVAPEASFHLRPMILAIAALFGDPPAPVS